MLKLQDIVKEYQAGDTVVHALKGINLEFRKHEFVSILGQSGCGKTTMLNIIGGLDRYTSGDLSIDGISTKKYKDRDWDTYRNHRIGFVFQNYNLIPHQSVLANVELALTLSGVSKAERRKRAVDVLTQVGLGDQIHKKPSQMSGGQMQRVAIARALINEPDILLADEPTGALDSETSVQIMEILKGISKDKLIIMVTHNPELAEQYSSRIIRLLDGKVIDDSNPYNSKEQEEKEQTKEKHTSMSMFTALSLSLNNLMTKKTRTFLTAFAGSIGIIGIALIMSLSSGLQAYIDKVERDTLSSYPLTIQKATVDMSSMFMQEAEKDDGTIYEEDRIYSNNIMSGMMNIMITSVKVNNLKEFKEFIDSKESGMKDLVNDIQYTYDVDLMLYKSDTSDGVFQVNPATIMNQMMMSSGMAMGMGGAGATTEGGAQASVSTNMMTGTDVFSEMMDNEDVINAQYDVIAGRMPEKFDEVVVVVTEDNRIPDYSLYALGIMDFSEFMEKYEEMHQGKIPEEKMSSDIASFSYDDFLNLTFKLVVAPQMYAKENGVWMNKSTDPAYMKDLVDNGLEVKVVGIIRPNKDAANASIVGNVAYTAALTEYVVEQTNACEIVKEQVANKDINVFTGKEFLGTTYEVNAAMLGISDLEDPFTINIYPKDFDSKEKITDLIADYNKDCKENDEEEKEIEYTDYIGLMMSSVSNVINAISYILIAFVAISLVVSSIMIGIITYISVLERTKEIGILRSIGASKKDISRVFNAETLIVGFVSGGLGIIVTLLLNIPINIIIENISGIAGVAALPVVGAVGLIFISMFLTFIAGLIPSKVAAKKDPVVALRTE